MGKKSRRTGLHSRRQARAFASGFSRTGHTRTPRSTGAFIIPCMGTPLQRGARRTAGPSPRTTARHRARTRTREAGRNSEASSLKVGEARLPAIADDKFPSGTGPPNARRARHVAGRAGGQAPTLPRWAQGSRAERLERILLRPPRPVPSNMEPPRPHTALRRPYGGITPVH